MIHKLLYLGGLAFFLLIVQEQAQGGGLEEKETTLLVSSDEVHYAEKEMNLIGQVVVQHSLGQISASRLSLAPFSYKKKNHKNTRLKAFDNVHIQLKEGGELFCQQAEVDYTTMQGIFLGSSDQPEVVYLHRGGEKNSSARVPLELRSSEMTLDLMRQPLAKTSIKQMTAKQNVKVIYDQDCQLLADEAVYQRGASADAGLLTLSATQEQTLCQMTNLNGDFLYAKEIKVDTLKRQIWLDHPQGTLYVRSENAPAQTIEFSSNELIWDEQLETLQLKGDVLITYNQHMHIQTPHELSICRSALKGKKTLHLIRSPQNTYLSYFDGQKGAYRQMTCPGCLVIDHERQEMVLAGDSHSPLESRQVYLEGQMGEVYADHIYFNYTWKEGQLVPEKVILEGDARLINRFNSDLAESRSILHYALADRVDYFPKQHEMSLTSLKGKRVLLFDKVNNVQMSASSLNMHYDAIKQKPLIQGIGDVRFTFMEQELAQFKQSFRLEEPFQQEPSHAKLAK